MGTRRRQFVRSQAGANVWPQYRDMRLYSYWFDRKYLLCQALPYWFQCEILISLVYSTYDYDIDSDIDVG